LQIQGYQEESRPLRGGTASVLLFFLTPEAKIPSSHGLHQKLLRRKGANYLQHPVVLKASMGLKLPSLRRGIV
jgi:hypothetical protein